MMISKIFLILTIAFSFSNAKEYKAVFDCSSKDSSFIKSRMWLIGKTMDMIEAKGDKAKFAVTLHGGCVAMVSNEYDMLVEESDLENIEKAQSYLKDLSLKRDVDVTVCAMSLASKAIDQDSVLEFIKISPNSFIDTIEYQNNGYALMSFK
jgi:intracellular sulfur oxidation DsrE/DsrF family protein